MKIWIARDFTGSLFLYKDMPRKRDNYFLPGASGSCFRIDTSLFPSVIFENSPQQVEIKLIEDKESSNE